MSADQILFLALLAAAFAVGWAANAARRRRTRTPDPGLLELIDDTDAALSRALGSYTTALGMWSRGEEPSSPGGASALAALRDDVRRLDELSAELDGRLSAGHPLRNYFERARFVLVQLSSALSAYERNERLEPDYRATLENLGAAVEQASRRHNEIARAVRELAESA